ncbi:MAG: hypothetical protein ACXVCP_09005 [Bdellovibrio sp.]
MKKYLILGALTSFLSVASAGSLENLGCYSGPLYRALNGASVSVSSNGTKAVSNNGNILLQCEVGGNQCAASYNNYSCTVNFTALVGISANKVYQALNGQTVQISHKNLNTEACEYMHCVETTELSCATPNSCSVQSYITGFDSN